MRKKPNRTRYYMVACPEKGKIYPNYYYIWCYYTPKFWKLCTRITELNMYRKKICGIPYLSRYHAKHVAVTMFGIDILKVIHVTKGNKIIKQGITELPKKVRNFVIFHDKWVMLRRWIYPPEYQYNKHRRRKFIVNLVSYSTRYKSRKRFNNHYKKMFYGVRPGVSKKIITNNRKTIIKQLTKEIYGNG